VWILTNVRIFSGRLNLNTWISEMMVITGAGLIVSSSLVFWQLLPRNGRVHPFVRNSGISSMLALGLLTTLTLGAAMLWAGLSG